jgi:hypothetical protein
MNMRKEVRRKAERTREKENTEIDHEMMTGEREREREREKRVRFTKDRNKKEKCVFSTLFQRKLVCIVKYSQ